MERTPLLLGQHKVVRQVPLFNEGPAVKWWAERGRVHYEDERNGEYGSISWRRAEARLADLALALPIVSYDRDAEYRLLTFIREMKEHVIPAAKQHGGYYDPGAADAWWDRRAKSIVMPGGSERLLGQSPTLRDLARSRRGT